MTTSKLNAVERLPSPPFASAQKFDLLDTLTMQQRKEVPSVVSEVNVFTVQVEADGDNGHTDDKHGHRKTSKAASVGVGWGIRPPRRGPNNGRASGQAGGIRRGLIRGRRKA